MFPSGASRLVLALLICLGHTRSFVNVRFSLQSSGTGETQAAQSGETLHLAVRTGDLPKLKALLQAGVDVNSRDPLGGTPLLEAAWVGNADIVHALIDAGADVNAVHREAGATPLEYAVLTSQPVVLEMLLTAGADVNRLYRNGQAILHLAAARNNPTIIEKLLMFHAALDPADTNGNTPLDEGVLHDQLSSVACLLAHGANVNRTRPTDGRGPIHEASLKGFSDLVPVLIRAGGDPVQRDRFGQTPLDLALAYKNAKVVSELLKTGASLVESQAAAESAMETATVKGQTEIVQTLLQSGFDVNRPTAFGSTYLHDAALKNQGRIAQLLIRAGAKLEARNPLGATPLHDAALGGSVDVINVLLDSGAQIDARDSESSATPLMLAASLDRMAAVDLLLKRGANPRLTDRRGRTVLSRAQQNDDGAMVRLLQSSISR